MRPTIDPKWIDYFRQNGFPDVRGLSTGMEGAVYSLVENELIAKVWLNRSLSDLQQLKTFYDTLKGLRGPIATPDMLEVKVVDSVLVSIERYLVGRLLQTRLEEDDEHADNAAVSALITVL